MFTATITRNTLGLLCFLFLFAVTAGCDTDGEEALDPNDDIPANPGTEPPPVATGPLSPSLTLGTIDASNTDRIPLVVGGLAVRLADNSLQVVGYDDETLTVVVDGVVQGKRISEGMRGLSVDIAFIVDNTSSMSKEIFGVQTSLLSFTGELERSGQDVAAGIVAFGDEIPMGFAEGISPGDSRAQPAVYGFVDLDRDLTVLSQFVENLRATDPGSNRDLPELGLAALDFARRTFSWRAGAQRVYVIISDDASWGRGFGVPNNKGIDTDYFTSESLAQTVREEGSVIHVYSPQFSLVSPPAYDMRVLADETGGIWTRLDRAGLFDLTTLGIIETTLASTLVEFVRDTPNRQLRTVRVHVSTVLDGERIDGERSVDITF
ncbi:MAG: vWA domain-containing protein [Bacteroidota bacterium]